MRQNGFSNILILLILVLMVMGGFIYYQKYLKKAMLRSSPQISLSSSEANKTPDVSLEKCTKYGVDKNKDDLYAKYTVKSGDTLLSVARNQLGDVSRVGDIIYINRDTYPGLSTEKPFLEVGWILYLPPDYIKHINVIGQGVPNLPFKVNGEIINITEDGKWVIKLNQYNPKYTIVPDANTKFIGEMKTEYKSGDCLTAVIEGNDMKVFTISPQ